MPARRPTYRCKGPPECTGRTTKRWGYCASCAAFLKRVRKVLEVGPRPGEAAVREEIHRARAAVINEMEGR